MKTGPHLSLKCFALRTCLFVLTVAFLVSQVMTQDPPATTAVTPPAASTPAPAPPVVTTNLSTNCTVDKCSKCVDPVQITCASCDSGYYVKTYNGGNKSYDACWAIWKLVLIIIGALIFLCLFGLCLYYFKKRGLRGNSFCCGD